MQWKVLFTIISLACLLFISSCTVQDKHKEDEAAIRKKSDSYVKAFNNQDSKVLAALWDENGELIDPKTGKTLKGREEIEAAYRTSFDEPEKATLKVSITNIAFPEENRAVEAGIAIVARPGQEADRTVYKAYYEKKHDNWLLVEVREVETGLPPSNYEHLTELGWLIGSWTEEDADSKIETVSDWDKHKNFITQHFTVEIENALQLEGKQIIGWDASNEKIRSWVFDSDGGFGEGVWEKEGDTWIVETSFTLADGRQGSAINIYTPIDKNSYTWESTGREIGGNMLPNIEPVKVMRKNLEG